MHGTPTGALGIQGLQVGAGLATVLGNTQVVLVGIAAWILLRERPSTASLTAIPVVLVGVVLISGVIGKDSYGVNPQLGVTLGIFTGISYAGYLLIIRRGSNDTPALLNSLSMLPRHEGNCHALACRRFG